MVSKSLPPIAIMQGRLLPPEWGFQAFPIGKWSLEFSLARDAGVDAIEWVYDVAGCRDNPLASEEGIKAIKRSSESTGVGVWSICADYFMEKTLLRGNTPDKDALELLLWLIQRAKLLDITYIILPFVDHSSITTRAELQALERLLLDVITTAETAKVELHLETDWQPETIQQFLLKLPSPYLKMNYDIGNSASLGRCPVDEFKAFSGRLGSVHVKDRKLGGQTVPLGKGAADLGLCIDLLKIECFDRWLVLQAARGLDGQEVELASKNVAFAHKLILERRLEEGRHSKWN